MLNFQKLFDWRFWLAMRPNVLSVKTAWFGAIIFAVIIATAFIFKFLVFQQKKNPLMAKLFKKLQRLFFAAGLVGFVLLFFSYEQIYLLGSRFWYLLWLLGFLVWLGFIVYYLIVKMPKEKEEIEKRKRLEKYLPR